MEKKMYNKPEVEIIAVEPSSIICASITGGPGVDPTDPPAYGD